MKLGGGDQLGVPYKWEAVTGIGQAALTQSPALTSVTGFKPTFQSFNFLQADTSTCAGHIWRWTEMRQN